MDGQNEYQPGMQVWLVFADRQNCVIFVKWVYLSKYFNAVTIGAIECICTYLYYFQYYKQEIVREYYVQICCKFALELAALWNYRVMGS